MIPVFGKILISQTDLGIKTKSSCSTFAKFITGCAGLFLITVTIKKSQKSKDNEKKDVFVDKVNGIKDSKQEETEKKKICIEDVSDCKSKLPQDKQIETKEKSVNEERSKVSIQHDTDSLHHKKQAVENKEQNQEQIFQVENTLKEEIKVNIQYKTDFLYSNQEIVENDEQIEETKVPVDNKLKEEIEVSFQHETGHLSSNQEYSVLIGNILSRKTDEFNRKEQFKREWCYYQEFELEDVDWIRKIKTFKITKVRHFFLKSLVKHLFLQYPKTHQASLTHHGSHHNCLESLQVTKLTSTADLNTVLEHDTALISFEGGNNSRQNII